MTRKLARFDYDEGEGFSITPRIERERLEKEFAALKNQLVSGWIEQAGEQPSEDMDIVAGQAAGLAWTTGYPLLVFPVLFEELAGRERTRSVRQQQIIALTEGLLEQAV